MGPGSCRRTWTMNGRALPTYAVFDDYRYTQRIAVVVRWFLLAGFLFIHNYRADPDVPWLINNGLAVSLCGLNAYVHWRVWRGRHVTLPYVLALSAMDLVFITLGILATSRFENTFFVLYYPAIVGLAVVAPSRRISFGGVALVAAAYSALSIGMEPQVDFDLKEERILLIRLISMFAVVAAGNLIVSIERQRRREAVEAERQQAGRTLALERKAREADEAAREERDKIARDIHDGIAQSIYALNLSIEGAAELAEKQGGPVSDRLHALEPGQGVRDRSRDPRAALGERAARGGVRGGGHRPLSDTPGGPGERPQARAGHSGRRRPDLRAGLGHLVRPRRWGGLRGWRPRARLRPRQHAAAGHRDGWQLRDLRRPGPGHGDSG